MTQINTTLTANASYKRTLETSWLRQRCLSRYRLAETVVIDAETREIAEIAAKRNGLGLDDTLFAEMCEGVPYALAMSRRLETSFRRDEEPANVFLMPH